MFKLSQLPSIYLYSSSRLTARVFSGRNAPLYLSERDKFSSRCSMRTDPACSAQAYI